MTDNGSAGPIQFGVSRRSTRAAREGFCNADVGRTCQRKDESLIRRVVGDGRFGLPFHAIFDSDVRCRLFSVK